MRSRRYGGGRAFSASFRGGSVEAAAAMRPTSSTPTRSPPRSEAAPLKPSDGTGRSSSSTFSASFRGGSVEARRTTSRGSPLLRCSPPCSEAAPLGSASVAGRQDPPDSVQPARGRVVGRRRVGWRRLSRSPSKRRARSHQLRALGRRGWTRTTMTLSHGTFAGAQFPAVACGAGGRSSASSVRSRCVPAARVLLPAVRSRADLLLARVR